jgi:nucleotide-binding universal stress UspA family protein
MGAYSHSAAREALFGGPTRETLQRSIVPVLMGRRRDRPPLVDALDWRC